MDSFHRELGLLMWDKCGMARDKAGLEEAIARIPKLARNFGTTSRSSAPAKTSINRWKKPDASRISSNLASCMCRDALDRNESCGGHFREEYQTPEGEALRDDENYAYVSAWKYEGEGKEPTLIKEPLVYEQVKLSTRSYK